MGRKSKCKWFSLSNHPRQGSGGGRLHLDGSSGLLDGHRPGIGDDLLCLDAVGDRGLVLRSAEGDPAVRQGLVLLRDAGGAGPALVGLGDILFIDDFSPFYVIVYLYARLFKCIFSTAYQYYYSEAGHMSR